jgi:UDP-N-acetylmuramoylalanine--D-glutamate ligase
MKCYLAGNIGLPFSEIVLNVKPDEYVALEVSSFQLDFIDEFKPKYSVILNITPDHLDRYDNRFDLYIKSKMKIVENQADGDIFIYNGDDGNIPIGLASDKTKLFAFSLDKELSSGSFIDKDWIVFSDKECAIDICNVNDLSLKGEHNLQNSLAVINIAKNIGIENNSLTSALASFEGVEHRLEFVREFNGIQYINDSKATNVDSVWYALRSFNQPIYLILGGKDKGNDYTKISDEVRNRVKKIYAIGSSADKIYDFFKNITEVEKVENLNESVLKGSIEAPKNSILLLSPACASFDMFKNYEDRGIKFKQIVNELA